MREGARMLSSQFQELLEYPEIRWAGAVSDRWKSLCDGLRAYNSSCKTFPMDKERKWELVSAFQKSIRRAAGVHAAVLRLSRVQRVLADADFPRYAAAKCELILSCVWIWGSRSARDRRRPDVHLNRGYGNGSAAVALVDSGAEPLSRRWIIAKQSSGQLEAGQRFIPTRLLFSPSAHATSCGSWAILNVSRFIFSFFLADNPEICLCLILEFHVKISE